MGYESKFFAVKEYSFPEKGLHKSQVIATLDVCKMGYGNNITKFKNLFDTEAPFTIYMVDYNSETGEEEMMDIHEDKYGDILKYISDKQKGIDILNEIIKEDDYWRFVLLLDFMKMFLNYDDVYIVHYGY